MCHTWTESCGNSNRCTIVAAVLIMAEDWRQDVSEEVVPGSCRKSGRYQCWPKSQDCGTRDNSKPVWHIGRGGAANCALNEQLLRLGILRSRLPILGASPRCWSKYFELDLYTHQNSTLNRFEVAHNSCKSQPSLPYLLLLPLPLLLAVSYGLPPEPAAG
jgi:hypothetical protein